MERRSWGLVALGGTGLVSSVAAGITGRSGIGTIAAAACVALTAVALWSEQRGRDLAGALADSRRDEEAAARRAQEARDELAELSSKPGESVFDPTTGLLDRRIFDVTFDRKLAAARRHLRPLTVMIIDLGPDLPADPRGRADTFRRIGEVATETLRDADVPCRIGETTFGIILEDTAEAGGFWAMDRLRLAAAEVGVPLLHVALATYPNHGPVSYTHLTLPTILRV